MSNETSPRFSSEGVTGFGWLLIVLGGCASAWAAFSAGDTEAVGLLILAQLLGPVAFLAGWVLIATGVIVDALQAVSQPDRDPPL